MSAASPRARATCARRRRGRRSARRKPAVDGFLRSAGLTDIAEAHIHSDPKKGDFYVAHIVKPGRAAEEIIAELVPAVIRDFPWPKSMRWGKASAEPGSLRWVRPLQSIVCTFGPETEEPVVVDFAVDGIRSGNVTYGHRFHAPGAISVRRFADYAAKLEAAKVVIDAERRKQIILADAGNLAFANGLRAGRGRRAAGRSVGPGRMAGRADGRIRGSLPRNPRRSDPADHPRQPEVFRDAAPSPPEGEIDDRPFPTASS